MVGGSSLLPRWFFCVTLYNLSRLSLSYDGPWKLFSIGKLITDQAQNDLHITVMSTKLVRRKCRSNHILFENVQVILCLFYKDEFADRLSREGK